MSRSFDLDVAIVGAGFAGAATGWALGRLGAGVRVGILERESETGLYASGRSAGMGRQLAEEDETTALTVGGARGLRELGAGRFWTERGGLLTFDEDEHAAAYAARAERFGVGYLRLGALELERRGLAARAGLFVPSDGLIDVFSFLDCLIERAEQAGVTLSVRTAVTGVAEWPGGARLETTRGAITCRVVVDAGGAWAGRLFGGEPLEALRRHVFAVQGPRAAASESVPSAAPALSTQGPFVWHVGAQEVYLRPRADGSWLTSPCDERPGAPGDQAFDADALPMLQARVARFAPAWVESCAAPPERWSCQRTFAADRRMRIARDATRPYLVWAAALGGHGATAACAVGERAAALALAALA